MARAKKTTILAASGLPIIAVQNAPNGSPVVNAKLSTGPMLEATSPPSMRGFCQGVNITVMNFGAALSPFVLGMISDNLGTPVAIWICVAISFLAALINVPLIWVPGCNKPQKPVAKASRPLRGEDREMVEKALRGEWVSNCDEIYTKV